MFILQTVYMLINCEATLTFFIGTMMDVKLLYPAKLSMPAGFLSDIEQTKFDFVIITPLTKYKYNFSIDENTVLLYNFTINK